MNKRCLTCGNIFYKPKYESKNKWKTRKYCCVDCYSKCKLRKKRLSKKYSGSGNPMFGIRGKDNPSYMNNSPHWKGSDVSYEVLHRWLRRNKIGGDTCEHCGISGKRIDLANISGEYKRDVDDYKYLCVRCHRKFDITPEIKARLAKTGYKKGHIPTHDWTGKKHSKETIIKMKESHKKLWEERKNI